MVRIVSRATAIAGIISAQTLPAFADAPRQLYDKTIQVDWSTRVVEQAPDGRTQAPIIDASQTIYVSSAGRLFQRASRSNAKSGLSKKGDYEPGATRNQGGEAIGLRFEANKLIGNTAFAQGAVRFVASFDGSYTSCSVEVTYGRESGRVKRRGLDGVIYQIESQTVTRQSCSVREGNPFAGR